MTSVEWGLQKGEVQVKDLAVFKFLRSRCDMFVAATGRHHLCFYSKGINAEDLWSKSVSPEKDTMQVKHVA